MRAACAQPRKSSTLSETLSHASHLSSCSGEKELIVANQSPETELNIIKELLNEFRGLHELKLRCLEEDTSRRGELPQVSSCCATCETHVVGSVAERSKALD